jgi:hypothetical protein
MSEQKKSNRALIPVPPVMGVVHKKTNWVMTFAEAVNTPFGTVLTILFSITLGVGFNILRNSPSALVPAPNPAVVASKVPISVPPSPTPTSAATVGTAPISVPPPSTLADGAVASAVPPPPTTTAAAAESTAPASVPPPPSTLAASTAPVSVPPPLTAAAAATASTAPVLASPRPNFTAALPDRDEVAAQVARGRAIFSNGDVAGARLILRWAAEHDDPQAALALGETYDPDVLTRLGAIKFADPAQAREWYHRAADLGSAVAISRLDQLSNPADPRK